METADAADVVRMRRIPTQKRARDRVERILVEAEALIVANGVEGMRMSEVAERAGVSIGSLYQYFPDRAAIATTLAERYNAEGLAWMSARLRGVSTEEDLLSALAQGVEGFYDMYQREPAMLALWQATQGDAALHAVDAADFAAHRAVIEAALVDVRGGVAADWTPLSGLLCALVGAAVRFAITRSPEEARAVIGRFNGTLPALLSGPT